jgi:hypothetical protein
MGAPDPEPADGRLATRATFAVVSSAGPLFPDRLCGVDPQAYLVDVLTGILEGDRADRTLDCVGVDFDPAVIEETSEAVPVRERVANDLGELALLAVRASLRRSDAWRADEGTRSFLADGAPLVRSAAADVGLDR